MRTRKGSARRQAKRRLFQRAEGYVGGRRRLLRTMKENLVRAGRFAYRDRRVKRREFRRLWIILVVERIFAATTTTTVASFSSSLAVVFTRSTTRRRHSTRIKCIYP